MTELVHWLQIHGRATLDLIVDEVSKTIWRQGWYIVIQLGIHVEWRLFWDLFLSALNKGHVRIVDQRDELFSIYDVTGGQYIAKYGYQALVEDQIPNHVWWWKFYGKSLVHKRV